MKLNRLLSVDEYIAMGDDAVDRGLYRNDRSVFLPGMVWFQPWYWDYDGSWRARDKHVMISERPIDPNKKGFLSPHFWQDWAHLRSPICIVCPNGETWEIDRWSSNGNGWKVVGEFPNITCSPSIVVDGYHGYLRNGEFTPDIEGRLNVVHT